MSSTRRVVSSLGVVVAATLLMAGCQFGTPDAAGTTSAAVTSAPSASATSSVSTPSAQGDADAAAYLLAGTPYVPDANGEWSGHYGFWTDAARAVACDIWIFSGDSGGVSCGIRPGHEGQRSYAIPPGASDGCDLSSSNPADGTAIVINDKVFGGDGSNVNVGFSGCLAEASSDPTVDATRPVLPPGTTLRVTQTGFETYTCTVASCAESAQGSSFVFGLSEATFHQG
jgi:hypothetical protein